MCHQTSTYIFRRRCPVLPPFIETMSLSISRIPATSTPNVLSSDMPNKKELTAAGIGAIIGSVVLVILVFTLAFVLFRNRRRFNPNYINDWPPWCTRERDINPVEERGTSHEVGRDGTGEGKLDRSIDTFGNY